MLRDFRSWCWKNGLGCMGRLNGDLEGVGGMSIRYLNFGLNKSVYNLKLKRRTV